MIKTAFDQSAFLPFANLIVDTEGLYRMINDLSMVQRSLFKNKEGTIADKSRDFLASDIVSVFAEVEKSGLVPSGDAKQQEFVRDLVAYLRDLPVVKLTLAFGPTENFLSRINLQISTAIGRKAVLDVVVNEYIMGGAIFEYMGKVRQDTLNEKLSSVVGELVKRRNAGSGVVSSQ